MRSLGLRLVSLVAMVGLTCGAADSLETIAVANYGPPSFGSFLYLGDEARTRATLTDGWFLTSDLARIDADGYVTILGRSDDCFKSKGVLIAPSEVESAILSLGAFEEACVFAVPDPETGNRIGAALVPRSGAPPALLERPGLQAALAGLIAPFKLPHLVLAMDQLPKNPNGKTQRREVARLALARVT